MLLRDIKNALHWLRRPLRLLRRKNALSRPLRIWRGARGQLDQPVALVIDDQVPEFDRHAGAMGMRDYLLLMKSIGFRVVFYPVDRVDRQPYTDTLRQEGIEIVVGRPNLKSTIDRQGGRIAFTWLSRPGPAAKYIDEIRARTKGPIIYCGRDLHFLRTRRHSEIDANQDLLKEATRLEAIERRLFATADITLTFSDVERTIIHELVPTCNVKVVAPYVLSVAQHVQHRRTKDIIFVGGFRHSPNRDGMMWFLEQVWSLVVEFCPDVTLTIVGEEPGPKLLSKSSDTVRVLGHVPNLDVVFAASRVSIAPLRYGAGVKGKIVTAMSHGVPVVSTSLGIEGMELIDGQNVLVGDTPAVFARHILRLIEDDELWNTVSLNGLHYIQARYSLKVVKERFEAVLEDGGVALQNQNRVP